MNKNSHRILSIIITYNAKRNNWVEQCLISLLNSNKQTDIIVIDNASTDETTKLIEDKFPFVELIKSDKNLGFGRANNIGLKKCLDENYDYAFLLNQDAWVEENTIEKLIKQSELNPDFGILSPMHSYKDKRSLDFNFSFHTNAIDCPGFVSDLYFNTLKDLYQINFANAALWLITRDCLETIGLFDSIFFHYGEDTNYCHRLKYHKIKIGIVPKAIAIHDREESYKRKNHKTIYNNRKTSILIELCNINESFLKQFIFTLSLFLKDTITSVIKLDMNRLYATLKLFLGVLLLLPKILKNRLANKKIYI